ncbi:PP2C family protein-serine/threonine phosphatase [Rubellicoccus peritrichatus]|uniref:Protein phosphatase 2C domain-containing protein n=1 Tax=Rubellicoccus peritrichatus TaxID=3080537 RepID=A0AAQ3LHC1_9BACT|nr:protein phosphatase 2C domain-containing protein [Puniceicoccus sp. CR14]WOO42139.1 protein phosphatase 2C domain-containing protein [Puniceicoccus sp. CR14]
MPSLLQDQLRVFGKTDQGLMRSDNEDSLFIDSKRSVFAVADGLGGLPEGSMASELAVKTLGDHLRQSDPKTPLDFNSLFFSINERVFQKGHQISSEMGIGTTLTIAQIEDNLLRVGHVGDSGLIVFNSRSWRQVTHDHTMAQEMLDRLLPGEHAFIPEYFSHTLTRCIGQMARVESDYYEFELTLGDRILLFTDGVTKTMNLDEIHDEILKENDPETFVTRIIDTGNDRGGPDNITAIAIYCD